VRTWGIGTTLFIIITIIITVIIIITSSTLPQTVIPKNHINHLIALMHGTLMEELS
jgi:hypothetical protein